MTWRPRLENGPFADGALEYRTGETLVRGNFGLEVERTDREDISWLTVPERFVVEDDDAELEAGGNIERRFSPRLTGRLDLLQNIETENRTAGRFGRLATTEATGGESILRGALTWRRDEALALEVGAEGAFNFLDQNPPSPPPTPTCGSKSAGPSLMRRSIGKCRRSSGALAV